MDEKYVIGIDIGGTTTTCGLVNRRGVIVNRGCLSTRDYATAAEFAKALARQISVMASDNGADCEIAGIGVGAPCASYLTGEIEASTELPWPSPIPLARMLSQATGLPVRLGNDANVAAIGEMCYGAARGMRDFIVITLGTGVGSGIVCDGHLVIGHRGFGGELGHVKAWRMEHRHCGCGREDCLQTYCSAKGVVSTAIGLLTGGRKSVLNDIPPEQLTSRDVAMAARGGDPVATETFRITGEVLGEACAHFAAFSDPEAIILFGGVAKAGTLITEPMRESFARNALHLYRDHVKILQSGLGEADAAVLGASALGWNIRDVD